MVVDALLAWYDAHARVLPWRSPPGQGPEAPPPSPYRVWLSEVMLQQTTVATVGPYYDRFLARWPTVMALAAADDGDVMREWAGLGYYARARNLLACARTVAATGWPDTEAGLRALPGVGRYTAAAVASIAFGARAVVVDGNVERVVARLFAVATPLPAARTELYRLTDTVTPPERAGDFAQAMMDLGATVCTPRRPACDRCPLAGPCAARAAGDPARYPVKAVKAAKPVRAGTAFWIEVDGHVLLERRPAKGLLGGMLGLPGGEWTPLSTINCHPREGGGPSPGAPREMGPRFRGGDNDAVSGGQFPLPTVRHIFTHFELHLSVIAAHPATRPDLPGEWHPVATLAGAGLPTLFARAAAAVLAARAQPLLEIAA